MTDEKKEIETTPEKDIDAIWHELWAFAQSCVNWGESDVDKEKFIQEGKKTFLIFLIE